MNAFSAVRLESFVMVQEVAPMASAAVDYMKVLEAEISQTPSKYLPLLANIVHAFRESVGAEEAQAPLLPWQIHAIEEGIQAADAGDFASDEAVAAVFSRWGGNGKAR